MDQNSYGIKDVTIWAWILTCSNADEAVQKLDRLDKNSSVSRIPFFLVNFILQRRSISARSLRFLVDKIQEGLAVNQSPAASKPTLFTMPSKDSSSMMLLFVRLVRHARKIWANGLSDIAEILALMFPARSLQLKWQSDTDFDQYQLLVSCYNRALLVMSRPVHSSPYQSVTTQQSALLRVLRTMTVFKPHIPVEREGFQALLSVQLAHKKTRLEKEWAKLKALSWPPWKEEKSGLDADRGDIGSESRALGVVSSMTEAGYTKTALEQIASVYAGWDTDYSPTVQIRRFISFPWPERVSKFDGNHMERNMTYLNHLWAARIATTRTIREAWSAFLGFENEVAVHQSAPYFEMFVKIIFRRSDQPHDSTTVLAGDSKETFPEPVSPRHLTYVASDPPTLNALLERMLSKNIKPGSRLLSLLVESSDSLVDGLKYMQMVYPAILHHSARSDTRTTSEAFWVCIQNLPLHVLTVYAHLLARFPSEIVSEMNERLVDQPRPYVLPYFTWRKGRPRRWGEIDWKNPRIVIHHLLAILNRSNHTSASLWSSLLVAFTNIFLYTLRNNNAGMPLAYDAWRYFELILQSFKAAEVCLTLKEFDCLCVIWEAFALSGARSSETSTQDFQSFSRSYFERPHPLRYQCKEHFERLVMPIGVRIFGPHMECPWRKEQPLSSRKDGRPTLLTIPSYHTLHLLIRVLGAWKDDASLITLLEWMRDYAPDLDRSAQEVSNGARLRRLAVIALRVYIEHLWDTERTLNNENSPEGAEGHFVSAEAAAVDEGVDLMKLGSRQAKELRSARAKQIMSEIKNWGHWPSDEEVQTYLEDQRRFDSLRRKHASTRQ